jgi:hypothetical protein
MTTTILKSSISSHAIDVSKYEFHNGIDFLQVIDSVESMPGVLKSFKIRALTNNCTIFGLEYLKGKHATLLMMVFVYCPLVINFWTVRLIISLL